ncbi:hypothetical protein ACGFZB_06350 [Streptomyces cinerochromogenes]|uniref:Secreted protein n=1 Tax=Streptomyces cinerochromogenes TaxID=66422 RepID=A0ABW7AYU7_9ACTN
MSSACRTSSPPGPRARSRFKKIGGLTSAALVVAIGLITPAAANAPGVTSRAGVAFAGGCDHNHDHDCPKPTPTPTPTPTRGCFDIDSAVKDPDKYLSVVCNGRVYVLTVREAPPSNPQPVGGWRPVGGPTNVVDATLSTRANEVYVSVLTATGTVFQGVCTATEPLTVPCTFTQLPTPPG